MSAMSEKSLQIAESMSPKEKGAALMAIGTIMYLHGCNAAQVMHSGFDTDRINRMMLTGIAMERASEIVNVDVGHLVD